MAEPNISLLGATYSGVKGVTLPKSGGGTATFPWVEGSETKTQNGTYDVTTLAELIVNVSGSTVEMESGTYTPSSAQSRPTISFSKTHSEPPVLAVAGIQSFPSETSSAIAFYLIDFERILGFPVKYNSTTNRYGFVYCWYRGTGTTASGSAVTLQCGASDPGSGSNSYFRYYANESALMPYTNSGQRYWRSGVAITWKAYWL